MALRKVVAIGLLLSAGAWIAGCNKAADKAGPPSGAKKEGHTHEAWWCDEHGMPESVCAQCDAKLAAEFKAKGDWCAKHDRPDSQCFICHPELEAKFAAQYEAKYGKQPPKPTEGGAEEGKKS